MRVLALLVAIVLLAGFGPDRSCPPAGTVSVRDDGLRTVYLGEDVDEAALCVVEIQRGFVREQRRVLYGFWVPLGPDYDEARTQLGQLLAGGTGTEVTIREHVMTDSWQEVWRHLGVEAVGIHRALRLERQARLTGAVALEFHATLWLEERSGVPVRIEHRYVSGLRLSHRDVMVTHLQVAGR